MKPSTLLATAASALFLAATSAQALHFATTIDVGSDGTVNCSLGDAPGANGDRNNSCNALGINDSSEGVQFGFYSLGLGGSADLTFGGKTFTGPTTVVFEETFGDDLNETADISVNSGLGGAFEFVVSVPNLDAQNPFGFSFLTTGTWDTLRIVDTSTEGDDGFDLDAVGVVPLPAAAWLLLGVSGGLIAAKRRQARKAA